MLFAIFRQPDLATQSTVHIYYTVLSMRRARSRLRSPTRSQVRSASAINRAGRLVIYREWRSPEE